MSSKDNLVEVFRNLVKPENSWSVKEWVIWWSTVVIRGKQRGLQIVENAMSRNLLRVVVAAAKEIHANALASEARVVIKIVEVAATGAATEAEARMLKDQIMIDQSPNELGWILLATSLDLMVLPT